MYCLNVTKQLVKRTSWSKRSTPIADLCSSNATVAVEIKDLSNRWPYLHLRRFLRKKASSLWWYLRIETPDTNEAKSYWSSVLKFTVPMRQAMRGKGLMTAKDNAKKPVLHLCFIAPGHCFVGYFLPNQQLAKFFMGIRLKFPSMHCRSTLKLEEAFHVFIPRDEDERLAPGMWGVDLGACPGGWLTNWLSVRCSFTVWITAWWRTAWWKLTTKHHMVDGFKFEPDRKNVTGLSVTWLRNLRALQHLMVSGSSKATKEALFNLKLPMKVADDEVLQDIENPKLFLDWEQS